jgi:hypothetical protein
MPPEIRDRRVRPGDHRVIARGACRRSQPAYVREPEAYPEIRGSDGFDKASRPALDDIDRQDLDSVPLGVVDEDRRMVEAHRLRVEQRARVMRRVRHAQPCGFVCGARERRGVRLAEAELGETGDALEDLLSHRLIEIVFDAATDEAVAELLHLHT